jgi:hypothetical protein
LRSCWFCRNGAGTQSGWVAGQIFTMNYFENLDVLDALYPLGHP